MNKFANIIKGLCCILLCFCVVGCDKNDDKKANESKIVKYDCDTGTLQNMDNDNSDTYSVVKKVDGALYGAVFNSTIYDFIEGINKTSVFLKDINIYDMTVTEMNDNTIIQYIYAEHPYEAAVLYTDKKTGYIVSVCWLADMLHYDIGDTDDTSEIVSKAAVTMWSAIKKYSDSPDSSTLISWIKRAVEQPMVINGNSTTTYYEKGILLNELYEDDVLWIRVMPVDIESKYNDLFGIDDSVSDSTLMESIQSDENKDEITNNESSTSLDITKRTEETTVNFEEETTVPKVDNIIKLGEFADYDNIIKIGSSNKYKVQFDGEIFDMQVSSYRRDISACEDSVFWSEKNVAIIIDDDYSMNNKFYCSINAFNDYFSCERVMEAGYKVTGISISCLSNDNYKFDIENTRELHDFLINIADKMIKMYPVDEGINITSFTEYDKLIKLNSNNDIRVSFDNEVFDIHVSTYMSDLFFPISEGECLLWYDGDVAVELDYMYTRYDGDFHIYIRKLGEEFVPGEYPSVDSHIVASVDLWCVTDKYYEYDVANTEELYQFIINLAKKMMNHEY